MNMLVKAILACVLAATSNADGQFCRNIGSQLSATGSSPTPSYGTCRLVTEWLSCLRAGFADVSLCASGSLCMTSTGATLAYLDNTCPSILSPVVAIPCLCSNGGTCPANDGVCVCPNGFVGPMCESTATMADIISASLVVEGSCQVLQANHAAAYVDLIAQYTNLPSLWIHFNLCGQHPTKSDLMFLNFQLFVTNPIFVAQAIQNVQMLVSQVGGNSPLFQVLEVVIQKVENTPITIDCTGKPMGLAMADQCGICNGNNACLDCSGTPDGVAVADACGVCNGFAVDSSECSDVSFIQDSSAYPSSLPSPSTTQNMDEETSETDSDDDEEWPRHDRRHRHPYQRYGVAFTVFKITLIFLSFVLCCAMCRKTCQSRREDIVVARPLATDASAVVVAMPMPESRRPSRIHAVDAVVLKL